MDRVVSLILAGTLTACSAPLELSGEDFACETDETCTPAPPAPPDAGHDAGASTPNRRRAPDSGIPPPTPDASVPAPPPPVDPCAPMTAHWTRLDHGELTARSGHSAVYDPAGARMIVFGGVAANHDTLALSFAAGATPAFTPLDTFLSPQPRAHHQAIYDVDAFGPRMLIFGGESDTGQLLEETWQLRLGDESGWIRRGLIAPPPARAGHTLVAYDSGSDRLMLAFGGRGASGLTSEVDSWPLRTDFAWSVPAAIGMDAGPPPRERHSAAVAPEQGSMLVFGGKDGATLYGDLWQLSFASGAWTTPSTFGATPSARWGHSAIWDQRTRRVLIFGGFTTPVEGEAPSAELWSLAFSVNGALCWVELTGAESVPPARADHSAVAGPDGKMIVFGGTATSGAALSDLWSLELTP